MYLVPNTNWKDAGARFAAYFFNSDTDNTWVNLSAYNGMYACEKPAYNTVIFCRMNPSDKANNWNTKWNQTGDMKIGSQKYCVIPFDVWDGSNVWSNTTTFDTTNRFYLFPSDNWKESGARFEVYFYGSSGSKWVTMTKFSTSPEYYEVVKPSGNWTNMIFVRKDPASAQGTWDAGNWGQTGDLNFTSGNFYTVVKWNEDGSGWSTKK